MTSATQLFGCHRPMNLALVSSVLGDNGHPAVTAIDAASALAAIAHQPRDLILMGMCNCPA